MKKNMAMVIYGANGNNAGYCDLQYIWKQSKDYASLYKKIILQIVTMAKNGKAP